MVRQQPPQQFSRSQVSDPRQSYTCDPKGYMNFSEHMIIKGRYRLEKRIGKGTFSKVFAALDLQTENWIALKVVRNTEKYQMAAKVELHILSMILEHDGENVSNC